LKTKTNKNKTAKKQPTSGVSDMSETPGVAVKNKRVRGGYKNMSIHTSVDRTRTAFPYLCELDLLGMNSLELGLSPTFQEVMQNARDGQLSPEEIFAPYVATPSNTEKMLARTGGERPFTSMALGARAFHVNNAANGKAAVYNHKDLLEPQERFADEISTTIGMHIGFLHHCIDVSNIYNRQVAEGSVGLSEAHNRVGGPGKSTPYEAYHDLLLTKFDPNALNIPLNQRAHFTLADLAYRALAILAPISHGQTTTGSWTMSSDLYVTAKGYLRGEYAVPYGEMVDGDGNPRYIIQKPGITGLSTTSIGGLERINFNSMTGGQQNAAIVQRIRDCYEVGTLTDQALSTYVPGDPAFDEISIAGVSLKDLPGSQRRLVFSIAPRTDVTGVQGVQDGEMVTVPFSSALAAPRFFDDVGAMQPYAEFQATNECKRLWDQPTHIVVEFLRQASLMLTPQFRALDIPVVSKFDTPSSLSCNTPWSGIVDMCNMYSHHKMRFNPVKQIEANNGPYGVSRSIREAKWTVADETSDMNSVADLLEPVFGDLTAPSGIGSQDVDLKNLIGLLPARAFETLFTSHPSALDKRQRTVVLPTGRSSTSMSIASSASDADMDSHTSLLRELPFGSWRVTTLMPLSDIRYSDDEILSSMNSVGFANLPTLAGYPQKVNSIETGVLYYTVTGFKRQALTPTISVIGGGKKPDNTEVIVNTMERSAKPKKTEPNHYKMVISGDTEVPAGNPFMHFVNCYVAGIHNDKAIYGNVGCTFDFVLPTGEECYMLGLDFDHVFSDGKTFRATLSYWIPGAPGTQQTYDVAVKGTFANRISYDSSAQTAVTVMNGDIPLFGQQATDWHGPANPLTDVQHFADEATVIDRLFTTQTGGPATISKYELSLLELSCLDVTETGAWNGTLKAHTTSCTLDTEGQHVRSNVAHLWWNGDEGVEAIVTGNSANASTALASNSLYNFTIVDHLIQASNFVDPAVPGSKAYLNAGYGPGNLWINTHVVPEDVGKPEYLLPELNNIMIRLDLQLFDAAIAKYSNMRLYPRAINTDSRFKGLPYFGEPDMFLRGLVAEQQPTLVKLDHVSNSPFTTSNINEIRVGTEVYEQSGYQSALRQTAQRAGDIHTQASVDSILNAQDAMVKRGQI